MTEETNTKNEKTQIEETQDKEATKLAIDKPSDFKFHAAYVAYSETWDKISESNVRAELNEILESLTRDELDYAEFYKELDDYRRHGSKHYEFSRERIETQRKRDWRQKQTRSQRNQRHKGRH
jgi:hypothetical protein